MQILGFIAIVMAKDGSMDASKRGSCAAVLLLLLHCVVADVITGNILWLMFELNQPNEFTYYHNSFNILLLPFQWHNANVHLYRLPLGQNNYNNNDDYGNEHENGPISNSIHNNNIVICQKVMRHSIEPMSMWSAEKWQNVDLKSRLFATFFYSIKAAPCFSNRNRSQTANVRQSCMTKMLNKLTYLITDNVS